MAGTLTLTCYLQTEPIAARCMSAWIWVRRTLMVLTVLDENYQPIAGEYKFAQVTRDGLVVDFVGAVDLLRKMKARVEQKLGFELTSAASSYPPGVPQAEVRGYGECVVRWQVWNAQV